MTQPLRWGLLSTANIIQRALLVPLRSSKRNRLVAIASRNQEKAEAYAKKHKIQHAYGSYEALLADPEIDVIYNPLPNHLHAEWTIRAVEAGKHVLCEKPLALTLDEVDAITAAAQKHHKVVAEAFMYLTHPLALKVKETVDSGELGQIKLVCGSFTYKDDGEDNYRLHPEMGGGSLWDIGCYPLSYTRMILGSEPEEVYGSQVTAPSGIDESFFAQMRFPGEIHAQFDCSFAIPYHVFMEIVGTEGSLVIPNPFIPTPMEKYFLTGKEKTKPVLVKGTHTYIGEVEDMADAILLGKPNRVTLADSRANVAAILALFESARSGKPVKLVD